MRPVEISNDVIIEAGHALQTAGRNITGFALRQRVGGGNPSRLVQVWREHMSAQSEAKAEPIAELPVEVAEVVAGVSKELTDRLAALAVDLNDKAVKAAERRVAEVVRSAGEQREQAERELADAAATVEDLEAKLDAAEADGAELEKRLGDLQVAHQGQAVELAQVNERLASAEKSAKLAAEQHIAELARVNAALDAERQRHQVESGSLRGEIERQRAELATVNSQAKAADQTHQEQRKHTAQEAHRLAEKLTRLESDREAARKEAAQAREEVAKLRGQVEILETQQAKLTEALATRHGDVPAGDNPGKSKK